MSEQGLYDKYEVYERGDRYEVEEECFVLKPESDQAAAAAILTYANMTRNKELAADLYEWYEEITDTNNP